jgi:hypothetical protein
MYIYYDGLQEGIWFQNLHGALAAATLHPFPKISEAPPLIAQALSFDRPDIILADEANNPILILERTIEVPSGHNVGQRFARLVGAAKMRVPSVYFGPFKAYKHGGETQGPRYMNLRLFYAIEILAAVEQSSVTVINWPVDADCEIIQNPEKDNHVREYLEIFLNYYADKGLNGINDHIKNSEYEARRVQEREDFIEADVRKSEQYDTPPPSVQVGITGEILELRGADLSALEFPETVFYDVGMKYIRSDPYTGVALLYSYLYCGGQPPRSRNMVLHFPNITIEMWRAVGRAGGRKDERLFRMVADGILFSDGYLPKLQLQLLEQQ